MSPERAAGPGSREGRKGLAQSRKKDPNFSFRRVYLYLLGLGLMLFGVFAFYFRSYDHPLYGHIDLGGHHRWIGGGMILLSVAYLLLLRKKY